MTVSNVTTATRIFQRNLSKFDLDNDGIMASPELGQYGDALREANFFTDLGIDEDAFMLQLHHYDNQSVGTVYDGFAEDIKDGKNYMGANVFERAYEETMATLERSIYEKNTATHEETMAVFNSMIGTFDKNGDGIMSSPELGAFGDALRERGIFEKLGVSEDAFMLQLHHYDNHTIDTIKNGMDWDIKDGKNYMDVSVYEDDNGLSTLPSLNDVFVNSLSLDMPQLNNSMDPMALLELLGKLNTITSADYLGSLLNLNSEGTQGSIVDDLSPSITPMSTLDTNSIFKSLANNLPVPERGVANEVSQEVSDGVIDHFNQGQVGNCWFLSAVDSFIQTAEGRSKIDQSINTNADGSYSVKFLSDPDFEFTVTRAEIEERRKTAGVSSGDIDMQILELAYEKLQKSRMEDRGLAGIHIWEALAGEKLESSGDRPAREHAEALLKELTGGVGVTKGFGISFGSAVDMATGEAIYYSDTEEGHGYGHSFAIKSIDWNAGTISYENPWDTKSTKTMSLDAFYELLEKGGGFNWTEGNPL